MNPRDPQRPTAGQADLFQELPAAVSDTQSGHAASAAPPAFGAPRVVRFEPPARPANAGRVPQRQPRGEGVRAIVALVEETLRRGGVAQPQAHSLSEAVVLALGNYCGGRGFYLPRGRSIANEHRDAAIRREFTGRNYRDLANKYNLTDRSIRRIVHGEPSRAKRARSC